jgi:hypothetical protein
MSGGSFGYLYTKDLGDVVSSYGHVEEMANKLDELGFHGLAAETRVFLAGVEEDPRLIRIRDFWHAVEWYVSGDTGEEGLKIMMVEAFLTRYKAGVPIGEPVALVKALNEEVTTLAREGLDRARKWVATVVEARGVEHARRSLEIHEERMVHALEMRRALEVLNDTSPVETELDVLRCRDVQGREIMRAMLRAGSEVLEDVALVAAAEEWLK